MLRSEQFFEKMVQMEDIIHEIAGEGIGSYLHSRSYKKSPTSF